MQNKNFLGPYNSAAHFMEIRSVFCLYLHRGLEFSSKFCSSDPSINRNLLTSQYLKSKTSAHAQQLKYSLIHTISKFHDMVSVGN